MEKQYCILPKSYRKIALGFFILSILACFSVFYLIWAKVTIYIVPSSEKVSQEITFTVQLETNSPSLTEDLAVSGRVMAIEVAGSDVFAASGAKMLESNIIGEVAIINNYSKDQTLVETTRLASPENPDKVLVRLNRTVDVLAGQTLNVQVYPDDLDNFSGLEPMKFIIPGLWGPLQEKIYAVSSQKLSQGGHTVSVVNEEDLEQAKESLKEKLYQEALLKINDQLEPEWTLWPRLVSTQDDEASFDAEVGQETAEFTGSMKLKVIVVVFDESQLISLVRERSENSLAGNRQLLDLNPKTFLYSVHDYNLETGKASIKASFEGSFVLAADVDFFSKDEVLGKTEKEIKAYFSQFSEVKEVKVKFQPAWLKKTPRFKEKIKIEVGQ